MLAGDGADLAGIRLVRETLMSVGAVARVVATHKGSFAGGRRGAARLTVDRSFHTASPVEVDALAIAHGSGLPEQAALYPLAGCLVGDAALLARVFDAHSEVKTASEHLRALEARSLVDAVEALRLSVADHVADEEANLLPALAAHATAVQLDGLAARFEQSKKRIG